MDSFTFMQDVTGAARSQMPRTENKLARIDYSFDISKFPQELPKVIFDGESSITSKGYEVLSPYMPMPGDRVLMLRVSDTYVISGAVNKAVQTWSGQGDSDFVNGSSDQTNTSFSDIAGSYGPEVSVYTGPSVLVAIHTQISADNGRHAYMSFAVNGNEPGGDFFDYSLYVNQEAGGLEDPHAFGSAFRLDDIPPGHNTFTAKYRVNNGTGRFTRRHLSVTPL